MKKQNVAVCLNLAMPLRLCTLQLNTQIIWFLWCQWKFDDYWLEVFLSNRTKQNTQQE